mmetsp:Transcript_12525/g.19224  ORF Transcript_12525/g.19224 Transcript_12525/m.19224 type:complete len:100 (-) Transcript_12525:108-407(-)
MTAPVIMEPVKIAMTAPVIMEPDSPTKIAMTAPVISSSVFENQVMQFVLPESFKKMEEVPVPTNPLVKIKHIPERNIVCNKFNGKASTTMTYILLLISY